MNTIFPWVAVVDDDALVRAASVRLLGICGFLATGFQNSGEFLKAATVRPPGCALLDLHMPDMDGFALQEELRRISPATQVVFMTGDDAAESQTRATAAGSFAYLCKPVDADALFDTVKMALQKYNEAEMP